jgi:hypothetical protein
MNTPQVSILDRFLFGALEVFVDSTSGAIVAIIDKISGKNASGIFSEAYINGAATQARLAWESTADR